VRRALGWAPIVVGLLVLFALLRWCAPPCKPGEAMITAIGHEMHLDCPSP
jgi:hypothetical protein